MPNRTTAPTPRKQASRPTDALPVGKTAPSGGEATPDKAVLPSPRKRDRSTKTVTPTPDEVKQQSQDADSVPHGKAG